MIELNKTEIKLAEFLAKQRLYICKQKGVKNLRRSKLSDYEIHLEGAGSEIAFCKIMNIYPDTGTASFGYADCFTANLGAVDVKSTPVKDGRLIAIKSKADKPKIPDTYALMIGECPHYRFVGWISAAELLKPENIGDLGHGETFMIEQDQLNKEFTE